MSTLQANEQFIWAAGRSRIGLVLGPGLLVLGVVAALVFMPEETVPGVGYLMIGAALIGLAHVFSFVEFVATMRVLRSRPAPVTAWVLAAR